MAAPEAEYAVRAHAARSTSALAALALTPGPGAGQLRGVRPGRRHPPPPNAQLEHAKLLVAAELERGVSSNTGFAALASELFAGGRSPDWLRSQQAALRAIQPADLQRVARRYLDARDIDIGVEAGVSLKNALSTLGRVEGYQAELE